MTPIHFLFSSIDFLFSWLSIAHLYQIIISLQSGRVPYTFASGHIINNNNKTELVREKGRITWKRAKGNWIIWKQETNKTKDTRRCSGAVRADVEFRPRTTGREEDSVAALGTVRTHLNHTMRRDCAQAVVGRRCFWFLFYFEECFFYPFRKISEKIFK